ncbi:MAG: hypothetical protein J5711_08445 [Bacteroidales bacterium]|nr:hypothetical protein [Bacteroidales bacterium]
MSNLLLIGPSQSGKTTMLYSYKGEKAPEGATMKAETKKAGGFLGIGRDELTEIGGNSLNNELVIGQATYYSPGKVLFVFDGSKFIEQLAHPELGGEIWGRWLLYNTKKPLKKVHMVATHDDCVDNMRGKILDLIKAANIQYSKLLGGLGTERYTASCFEEPYFHCINAKDSYQVKELLNKIRKS